MKRKFVNRKLTIAAALAAGVIFGGGVKPVLAALWEVSLRGDGTSHKEFFYPNGSFTEENPWEDIPDSYPHFFQLTDSGSKPNSQGDFAAVSAWSRGKFTLVFDWVSDGEAQLPPAPSKVSAKLHLYVEGNYYGIGEPQNFVVTDGLEQNADLTLWEGQSTFDRGGYTFTEKYKAWNGFHLIQASVPEGQTHVEVELPEVRGEVGIDGGSVPSWSGAMIGTFALVCIESFAELDNRSVEWTVYPQGYSTEADTNTPTNKTFDAWISLGWKDDGVLENPLVGFYQGGGRYFLTAALNGQNTILNNRLSNYHWSVSPQTFVPQLPIPTASELDEMMPGVSTSVKNFHWDFGDNIASFPIDAVVNVTATDPSDGAQVSAQATIHYHSPWEGVDTSAGSNEPPYLILPPGTMVTIPPHLDANGQPVPAGQKPVGDLQPGDKISIPDHPLRRVVTAVTPQPNGTLKVSYGLDPDDNPDDPAYDLNQQIERAQDAYQEAIKQGATGVKYGLESYKFIAEQFAYGPLFKLGGAALSAVGGHSDELLALASKARQLAVQMRGLAQKSGALVDKLKTRLTQVAAGSDEATALRNSIDELEEGVRKLQAGADDLDGLAAKGDEVAQKAKQEVIAGQADETLPFADDIDAPLDLHK